MKEVNYPNTITFVRLVLIVIFIATYTTHPVFATILFIIAALGDSLDGTLARKFKQKTSFGSFFDILVDSIQIISALILLIITNKLSSWIIILYIIPRSTNYFYLITQKNLRQKNKIKKYLKHKPVIGKLGAAIFYISITLALFGYTFYVFFATGLALMYLNAIKHFQIIRKIKNES